MSKNIVVIGGGIMGLSSAYYLQNEGHQVTVIDRQAYSGEETSFANAGQISYGYSSPWAAPGIPLKAIKWLAQKHSPLVIKPGMSPELYLWTMQMLKNCTEKNYQINKFESPFHPSMPIVPILNALPPFLRRKNHTIKSS